MAARTMGSATISFGLVSVPVVMYSSSESAASVSFNMLHKSCGTRLKQQYICPKDNVVVERDEMAKGYEFSKGQYVLFSPEELKALDEKGTNTIDIKEFVPLAKVDRIYLEKAYYLGPDKGGERAYRLLLEALRVSGRAAVGQYSARGKQNLILVRPLEGALVLRCREIIRADGRFPERVPIPQAHGPAARGPQVADARREGREGMRSLSEPVEGQGLDVEAGPAGPRPRARAAARGAPRRGRASQRRAVGRPRGDPHADADRPR